MKYRIEKYTHSVEPPVINQQSFLVRYTQYLGTVCPSLTHQLCTVIFRTSSNGVRETTSWVVVAIENVDDGVPCFLHRNSLFSLEFPYDCTKSLTCPLAPAQSTALTFGLSIQGSRIRGPTECTTTTVLGLTEATALTRASPPCQEVRFLLWIKASVNENEMMHMHNNNMSEGIDTE